jgi:hypothetical protein
MRIMYLWFLGYVELRQASPYPLNPLLRQLSTLQVFCLVEALTHIELSQGQKNTTPTITVPSLL